MLRQLANLPFEVIVNTNPDNAIGEIFDELAKPYFFISHNYNRPQSPSNLDLSGNNNCLVYNLLGSYQEPQSLVLTENHQMRFIERISNQEASYPNALKASLLNYRHFIFLGVDFSDSDAPVDSTGNS